MASYGFLGLPTGFLRLPTPNGFHMVSPGYSRPPLASPWPPGKGQGRRGGPPGDPGIPPPSPLATLAFLLALPRQLKLVERKWLSRNRVQRSTALGVSPIFFPNLIVGLRVVFGSPCLAGPRIPVFDLCTSVAASQTVQSIIQSMPSLGSSSATAGSV